VPMEDVLVDVRVRAPPPAEAEFALREEEVMVRGPGAEEARPMDGGALRCGGSTALGFDEVGLSQDEKKSSSSAVAAGCAEALGVSTPSTTMPFGNLCVSGGVRGMN
jgi:hypothetical protein